MHAGTTGRCCLSKGWPWASQGLEMSCGVGLFARTRSRLSSTAGVSMSMARPTSTRRPRTRVLWFLEGKSPPRQGWKGAMVICVCPWLGDSAQLPAAHPASPEGRAPAQQCVPVRCAGRGEEHACCQAAGGQGGHMVVVHVCVVWSCVYMRSQILGCSCKEGSCSGAFVS